MANEEHVALLKQGVDVWNQWRCKNPDIQPDLSWADLRDVKDLNRADLHKVDLHRANLCDVDLIETNLTKANLCDADLSETNLTKAILIEANLREADIKWAHLGWADFTRANLTGAKLGWAQLGSAKLIEADLTGANLSLANMVKADCTGADFTACRAYGVSAWELKLDGARQQNLIITDEGEPKITVDNIEVAQFIYLLLHNQKIRDVIDTVTRRAVLILGRFGERKKILDAIREELRKHDYVPILFDFDAPSTRSITETVTLLARMSRFIIADLTDPSSIPKELEAIVPGLAVPVQPLLEGSNRPYAMFKDYWMYDWVLPVYRYEGLDPLLASLADKVIAPAEAKVRALEEKRCMIEAELTKAQ